MKTRIIAAAVILPAAIAVLIVFPPYVLTITLAVICAIGSYELVGAVNNTCRGSKATGKTPNRGASYAIIASVIVPFTMYMYFGFGIPAYIGLLAVLLILVCLLMIDFFLTFKTDKRLKVRQILTVPAAALVIPLMISCLLGLRMQDTPIGKALAEGTDTGRWLVMLPVIITVLTDSGAYFTGVTIGKHKPLPKISPNKTVEGFAGGIVVCVAAVGIYGFAISAATPLAVNIPVLIVYGLLGAVVTEIGDLAFSLIKRKCGIKDYGKLIPGHGGILDRLDSLIFTAPAVFALMSLYPAIA